VILLQLRRFGEANVGDTPVIAPAFEALVASQLGPKLAAQNIYADISTGEAANIVPARRLSYFAAGVIAGALILYLVT
jgi:hypothetical protein